MARILIADDDEVDRRRVAKILAELVVCGHELLFAKTGEEARSIMRQQEIDLVLLDMRMETEDEGEKTLDELKRNSRTREIPVIMLSGEKRDVPEFIARGAEDYLLKSNDPNDWALLRARVASCLQRQELRAQREEDARKLQREKRKVMWLLNALFPFEVANELLQQLNDAGNVPEISIEPRAYREAAVMFCDIVGFTAFCEGSEPREVVGFLKQLVASFELIAGQHRLEKIKTIGDSFMATAGLRIYSPNPVQDVVEASLSMLAAAKNIPPSWSLRIGVDFGPVVGGIVGNEKFQFDVWGRTVNMAARVESEGRNGRVNLSEAAWTQVSNLYDAEVMTASLKGISDHAQTIYVLKPQD